MPYIYKKFRFKKVFQKSLGSSTSVTPSAYSTSASSISDANKLGKKTNKKKHEKDKSHNKGSKPDKMRLKKSKSKDA